MGDDRVPGVTAAVVVKNRRQQMLRCLDALVAQRHQDFEIVIIDNCSTDGTAGAVAERASSTSVPLQVEVVEGRIGRLRNVAAGLASGELIAYTDSDCIPAPDWLSAGVRAFDDPAIGVVTGTTVPEHPPPYEPWHATRQITEQTWHFDACNVFFRREPLLKAGGFGDLDWGEDTVAGWAMLRAGWRPFFEPGAVVHHDVTYPGRGWHLRRVRQYGEIAAVIKRFPEARERLFWHRYFLRPRNAAFLAALLGLGLSPLKRAALALTIPYLRERGPHRLHPAELRGTAERIAIDAMVLAGSVRGSIRWRALVL